MLPESQIYSGTSGLSLPLPRYLYPPQFQDKSRLEYYASLFNSIEINSTFYKLPMASTISKWAASVPDDFRFTFKVWKEISHNKGLEFNSEAVEQFIQRISGAGDKKGCLLLQFPPGLKVEHRLQFEKLLLCIRDANRESRWRVAIEFRNTTWYNQDIYDLIDEYGMSLVIHDMRASASPLQSSAADFVYVRFHGPEPRYRGSYEEGFLYEYAQYINEWKAEGKDVFCYFNNTVGSAVENLQTLNLILAV